MPSAEVNGIRMSYEEAGRGEPLLLLHGALGAVGPGVQSGWSILQPVFAGRFHAIALEQRGHGRTGNPDGRLTYPQLIADLAAAVEWFDLGPVHLAGFSMGAEAGLGLALSRPDLIRSLVCVGANYHIGAEEHGALGLFDAAALERDLPDLAHSLAARHDPHHYPGYWRDLAGQIAAMAATGLGLGEDDLRRITVPTLLISGEADMFNGMEQALTMRRCIPTSELLIVNHAGQDGRTNHRVQSSRPEVVGPVMLDFLDRQPEPASAASATRPAPLPLASAPAPQSNVGRNGIVADQIRRDPWQAPGSGSKRPTPLPAGPCRRHRGQHHRSRRARRPSREPPLPVPPSAGRRLPPPRPPRPARRVHPRLPRAGHGLQQRVRERGRRRLPDIRPDAPDAVPHRVGAVAPRLCDRPLSD